MPEERGFLLLGLAGSHPETVEGDPPWELEWRPYDDAPTVDVSDEEFDAYLERMLSSETVFLPRVLALCQGSADRARLHAVDEEARWLAHGESRGCGMNVSFRAESLLKAESEVGRTGAEPARVLALAEWEPPQSGFVLEATVDWLWLVGPSRPRGVGGRFWRPPRTLWGGRWMSPGREVVEVMGELETISHVPVRFVEVKDALRGRLPYR